MRGEAGREAAGESGRGTAAHREAGPASGPAETGAAAFEDYWPKPGQKFDLVAALFGVPSYIGEPDLLSGKVQWLLNAGGTAILMYNGRKLEDMDFYRNLGTKVHSSDGALVSDEF